MDGKTAIKRWMCAHDKKTRADHLAMDGVEAAIDELFTLPDGSEGLIPHDHDLSARESVNCRCTVAYKIVPQDNEG